MYSHARCYPDFPASTPARLPLSLFLRQHRCHDTSPVHCSTLPLQLAASEESTSLLRWAPQEPLLCRGQYRILDYCRCKAEGVQEKHRHTLAMALPCLPSNHVESRVPKGQMGGKEGLRAVPEPEPTSHPAEHFPPVQLLQRPAQVPDRPHCWLPEILPTAPKHTLPHRHMRALIRSPGPNSPRPLCT